MRKTWKYLCKVTSLGIQSFIVNRKNLAIVILFEFLDAIGSMIFIEVLYGHITSVAGYTKYEMYVLYGVYLCQAKIMMMFCIGGIDSFSDKIISRDFDLVLLKPMSTRLLMMVPNTNIHQLISMQASVYMIVYGLIRSRFVLGVNILFALIGFVLGVILLINLFLIILPVTFWTINATQLNEFTFLLQSNASYPSGIYPKIIRMFLVFVYPVVLISNPCVAALFQKQHWEKFLLLGVVYVFVSKIITDILWKAGIRQYQCSRG